MKYTAVAVNIRMRNPPQGSLAHPLVGSFYWT